MGFEFSIVFNKIFIIWLTYISNAILVADFKTKMDEIEGIKKYSVTCKLDLVIWGC